MNLAKFGYSLDMIFYFFINRILLYSLLPTGTYIIKKINDLKKKKTPNLLNLDPFFSMKNPFVKLKIIYFRLK